MFQEEAFSLIEALKTECNKLGRPSPTNPIFKLIKPSLLYSKSKLKEGTSLYRARLTNISTYTDSSSYARAQGQDELNEGGQNSPELLEQKPEAGAVFDPKAGDFSTRYERTVIDLDAHLKPKLGPLVFAASALETALGDFRGLVIRQAVMDEMSLTVNKKLVDFTSFDSSPRKLTAAVNAQISLYLSMYLRDPSSNFYNAGRFILEYCLQSKFDGVKYLSNYDKNPLYVFFGSKGIKLMASRNISIEQAERVDAGGVLIDGGSK